jgi:formyltetrahydrofolate deformylase
MSPRPRPGREYVLTLACPDRPGIVYAVSSFLVQHSGHILESQQFGDRLRDRFFMRVHFEVTDHRVGAERLRHGLEQVAGAFQMSWDLVDASTATRVLIMVSRLGHCLNDLLFRLGPASTRRTGGLNLDVRAIVSNHRDFAPLAAGYGIPYHHIPVTPQTRDTAGAELLTLAVDLDVDLVVLARYMQVLPDEVCKHLEGRAINIHHSFLPSFKGARPYHQAHDRGVKLVGATAHYVTPDLDEGPIIEQDVVRVDHALDPEDLAAAGRDVEAQVLARAVKWHSERRVLLNGSRTVVFR